MKVELDLSNFAMEVDLKGATGINKSALVSKTDLASLKTKVDNLDVDKLKTVPASDFIKLSNVVDKNVVKKTCMIKNWLPKSILSILIYQALVD